MKTKQRAQSQSRAQSQTESHTQQRAQAAAAPGTELFDQAMKSYEQALRTGVRLQEDTARWWTNLLNQSTWSQDWQRQVSTVMSQAIPTAQKNLEDSLRLVDQGSKTSLNLLKRAMDGTRSSAGSEVQSQVQELWQSSLNVLQSNMHAITESQAKAMESWTEFVRKGVASTTSAASSAAAAATAAR
jgi:BMFP domain-containing protein YqiC